MNVPLKRQATTSSGGVEVLFQGDFRELKHELDQRLWPAWLREPAPASGVAEQKPPDWVMVEVENGYLRVDRSRFSPEQEAYYQASQYMSREDWLNAAEAFRKVLDLNPDPILRQGVTIMMGIAYSRMGDLDRAARAFEETIRLNEHNDFAHLFLGSALMLAGRLEDAIGPLKRTLELNPRSAHVNFYLGHIYEDLGQWENAVASYNAEIENNREFTGTYEQLAKLYYRLAEERPAEKAQYYLKTIETYKKWVEVDPSNSAVRNLIGYLYSQVGNLADATDAFEKAVEANPDNLTALSNWGLAYLNAGRVGEARDVFKRLAAFGEEAVREQLSQTSPENLDEEVRLAMAETHQLLGAAILTLHQSQAQEGGEGTLDRSLLLEAEAAFKTALRYNPADVHSLYNLALVYWWLKLRAAAVVFFGRVLELNPEHEDAAKGLHAVREELEQWRRWLRESLRRFVTSSRDKPLQTEDLVDKLAEFRAKLYEGVDPAHQDEAFTPEDLLNAMMPVAEWLGEAGNPEIRFDFAARLFNRGWLSSGKAARLAGVDRVKFLTNLHTVGIAALDLDEEEMERQSRYVNTE